MDTDHNYFVAEGSVVRKIWGKSDTILFIFAGAAAEFALNKAVDWLYFTGKLPADPIGRLFSTVGYARQIVFSNLQDANAAIDKINAIHTAVENKRGSKIPEWAYRDVLFMLIHYSIAAFELWERKLTEIEKDELYDVFFRMGKRMNLKDLPAGYAQYLQADLIKSNFTTDLFMQYRKSLGSSRYWLLLQTQKLIVPDRVMELLHFNKGFWPLMILLIYKICKKIKLDGLVKAIILPAKYKQQIKAMDMPI